jgi:hypothetical protein
VSNSSSFEDAAVLDFFTASSRNQRRQEYRRSVQALRALEPARQL